MAAYNLLSREFYGNTMSGLHVSILTPLDTFFFFFSSKNKKKLYTAENKWKIDLIDCNMCLRTISRQND